MVKQYENEFKMTPQTSAAMYSGLVQVAKHGKDY